MNRYRLTLAVRDDLKRISRHIAVEMQSPQGARRLRSHFLEDFQRLAQNPLIGQACAEFGANMRIWPVGNYVVLYRPQKDGIDIVQVAHGAQNLPVVVRKIPADL